MKRFHGYIPEALIQPYHSLKDELYKKYLHCFSYKNEDIEAERKKEINEEITDLISTVFASLKYSLKERAGHDQREHFSTFLYEYINRFPELVYELFKRPSLLGCSFEEAEKIQKNCESRYISRYELLEHSTMRKTPLYKFFHSVIPFPPIPFIKRFEHTHIMAKTGHGKTQLLHHLIYNDLEQAQQNKLGFCIIDNQTDLINTISRLSFFDPKIKKSLADKLVIIDAGDVGFPPSLNMFDMGSERLKEVADPIEREKLYSFTISLYSYIFSDLVEGKLTMYQENIFNFCAILLLHIPNATLLTFVDLLENFDDYKRYLPELDDISQKFFKTEYHSKVYEATKKQISARLWAVLRNSTFRNMFVSKKSKIDMFKAMNQGKVVLINTSKMILQEESKILGKFFIALILQSIFQRASIAEEKRKPYFVYIDEAQEYFTEKLSDFFVQARKYKVGLVVAHQNLKQLKKVSSELEAVVLDSTAIKFTGRVESGSSTMAKYHSIEQEDFKRLRKIDKRLTEYFCFVDDVTTQGVKICVPFGKLNNKGRMSNDVYKKLINRNRQRYCTALNGEEGTEFFDDGKNNHPDPDTEKKTTGFKPGGRVKL